MQLIVAVEGQTEEQFVRSVLAPHLNALGVFTSATIVGKVIAHARGHRRRGGGHFGSWRKDLLRILGSRRSDLRVTTLLDLYGLPGDFPALKEHRMVSDTQQRCKLLEDALGNEIKDERFIPYLQRHEFEALVLAALGSLCTLFDAQEDLDGVARVRAEVAGSAPEDVDDGETTAPSKRLECHIPGFRKTLHGPLATSDTGLRALRDQCPRFDRWVECLETLGSATSDAPR